MNLRRRRRSRPRGRARLALTGDFPAADRDVTEAIQAIPPAPWDGTTVPLAALRGQPHYAPPDPASHPYPAPPAAVLSLPQARAVMTLNPRRPGGPGPTPRGLKAAMYIEPEVCVLEDDGKLYDADASDAIARKAARRLRGARRPWKPSEEHRREIARIFGGDVA